jgi:phage-related protein
MTLEDTCKIIGALSNYGIKASQAGTTFRRILTNLADADIQKRLKGFGVDVVDFDTGKMREVSAVLRDLGRATEEMPKDIKLTLFKEIFGLWAIAGGAKLTVAQFDYLIAEINNASGKAQETAREMDAGIGGSFRRMWSVIEGVSIAIGGALAPALKELVTWWVKAASGLIPFIDQHQTLIVLTAKYITIIIGVGAALLTLGTGFLAIASVLKMISAGIVGITYTILSTFSHIGGIFHSLRLVVGSFVSVFGGITLSLVNVVTVIVSVFSGVISVFVTVGSVISGIFGTIARVAIVTIGTLVRNLLLLGRAVVTIITFIAPIIAGLVSMLVTGIVSVLSMIISAMTPIFRVLLTALAPLVSTCITSITLLAAAISGAIVPIITLITSSFHLVGTQIVTLFSGILTTVGTMFAPILTVITSFCTAVLVQVGTMMTTIVTLIGTILFTAIYYLASLLATAVALISITLAAVIQGLGLVLGTILAAMSPLLVVLVTLSAAAAGIYGVLANLERIGSIIATILNGLVNIVATCFDLIFTLLLRFTAVVVTQIVTFFTWIASGLWSLLQQITGIVSAAVSNLVTSLNSSLMSVWNEMTRSVSAAFSLLQEVLSNFGTFFILVLDQIGIAVSWLRERFASLCNIAVESYNAIVAAMGRGDMEAALGVIWATLKLLWVQGATSLLATWYWLVETLQLSWTTCVFKIAEILTNAWFGVQEFWAETIYTMQTLWLEFSNEIISNWKRAEQAIAHGIGWILAQIEGLDPNEMANILDEDYQRQAQQREAQKTQQLNDIEKNRNRKSSSIQTEKEGTLANLKHDFEIAAQKRDPEHETKLAAQEAELAKAKDAYKDAINRAKNPPNPTGGEEESLGDKLKQKINDFSKNRPLENRISVSGSFSAAAIQSMGAGSTMDRVAKAAEKSEKHLEKMANKNEKAVKQSPEKKNNEPENESGDNLAVKELKQQTRYLRNISEQGLTPHFA